MTEILSHKYIILPSNPLMKYSNDKFFRYRPNTDLIYFVGTEDAQTIAVITPNSKLILFVKEKDPHHELWEGKILGFDEIKTRYGADEVHGFLNFKSWMLELNASLEEISYNSGINPEVDRIFFEVYHDVGSRNVDLLKSLHQIRIIKDSYEIDIIRKSQSISIDAHLAAIAASRVGLTERNIEGIYNFTFEQKDAILPTHVATIASGDNGLILHYRGGNKKLEEGDLLLVDTGCEYQYYTSDIARTWPVNGKLSQAQRDIYQIVLNTQKECIELVGPGVAYADIHCHAVKLLVQGLCQLGIFDQEVDEIIENDLYKPYFPHGIGHWLGIDTHDCPTIDRETTILQPGMILTIEPGLYLHHHDNVPLRYRGIAIRIEDNILVTEDGYENLSKRLPKEMEEIEKLVGSIHMLEI